MNRKIIFVVLMLTVSLNLSMANALDRTALVIGNSNYKSSLLKNPVNDATDMSRVLKQLGFSVILKINAGRRDMMDALNEFGRNLVRSEIGIFYFAGHGMQIDNTNYLIPVGARVESESDVMYEGVEAGRILGKMKDAGNRLNVVILDACRNNPFARSFRASSQGLAKMDAPPGSILAYATSPGSLAEDGSGRNGVYTGSLLKNLIDPGLTVQELFNQTGLDVMQKTSRKQVPWVSSTPVPRFFLARGAPEDQNLMTAQPQKAQLYVVTDPGGGQVRIMNIAEKYYDGIELDPGRYKLEGAKEGYRTKTQWVTINRPEVVDVTLTLTPEPSGSAVTSSTVTSVEQTLQKTEKKANPVPAASMPDDNIPPPSPSAGNIWKEPVTGMEFVWVPGGCYMMGSPVSGKTVQTNVKEGSLWYKALAAVSSLLPYGCVSSSTSSRSNIPKSYYEIHGYEKDETPVHQVCLDGFWMGRYEVTQGQWKKIMDSNPSRFKSGDDFPVENVAWNDSKQFITRLNDQTGQQFALPSEAQWEYAARSGGKNEKYAGGSHVDSVAWYSGNSGRKTHRVGTKAPNGLGIHDMSGNVREWCEDVFDENAYSRHSRNNPVITWGGSARALRGGSWINFPRNVRAAGRGRNPADGRGSLLGFRLCLSRARQ